MPCVKISMWTRKCYNFDIPGNPSLQLQVSSATYPYLDISIITLREGNITAEECLIMQ